MVVVAATVNKSPKGSWSQLEVLTMITGASSMEAFHMAEESRGSCIVECFLCRVFPEIVITSLDIMDLLHWKGFLSSGFSINFP